MTTAVGTGTMERYNITKEEAELTVKRINFMYRIYMEKNLNDVYINNIYEEWAVIAGRVKKGREIIDQTREDFRDKTELEENPRYRSLVSLYGFLMDLLGFYDLFFKSTLPPSRHKKLQEAILELAGWEGNAVV